MMMEPGQMEMHISPSATAATGQRSTRPYGALHRLRAIGMRRAEWWMMMLTSAVAWVFLAVTPSSSHGATSGWSGQAAGLAAMIVAMMLPLTAGGTREPARPGSAARVRAFAGFIAGYLAVWMLAMFAIGAAWRLTVSAAGWSAAVGAAIAAAVLWEIAPARWRRSGHERHDAATHAFPGRQDAGSLWSGVAAGGGCVKSCWALMAACVAFAHSLPVMAAFFVVQLHGRYRRPAFPALAALAILAVCLASLALTRAGHPHHPHV